MNKPIDHSYDEQQLKSKHHNMKRFCVMNQKPEKQLNQRTQSKKKTSDNYHQLKMNIVLETMTLK